MQSELRNTDHFGRLGGEEFLLICEDSSATNTSLLAQRILEKVGSNPVRINPQTITQVTVSIGATLMDTNDESGSAILSRADEALYRAKTAGRNRICWFQEIATLSEP